MRSRPLLPLLLPLLLLSLPADAAWTSRLAPVKVAAVAKAEAIDADMKPMTREKRAILSALVRLDRARDGLLDDLRDAGPLCRVLDRVFPGDEGLDPALGTAMDGMRTDALDERAALLAWMGRTGSDRDEERLLRGIGKADARLQAADAEPVRAKRASKLRSAVKALRATRTSLGLHRPRVDDPPSEGVAPDFSLVDVNPASATAEEAVSPRDYLGSVTAVYFVRTT